MKTVVICCILLGLLQVKVAREIVDLPNERVLKLLRYHKECAAQDPLGAKVIEEARREGLLLENPKFKEYLSCLLRKDGVQNADGSINKEHLAKGFGLIIKDSTVVEKLVEKCAQEQDTPQNTAFFLSKCFHQNSPVQVEIFPKEIPVPEKEAKKIIERFRACIRETGVDRELLAKTREGVYEEDPLLKEFTLCMAKKAGFLNEDGNFEVEVMREETLKLIPDRAEVDKLIAQCAVKKQTPQETAFHSHICFHKNAPGEFSINQFGAVSAAEKAKRNQIIKECAEETDVPRSVVLKALKGHFQDDPLLKQYFFCIHKRSGILNEAGEYKNDVMRKGLTEIYNAEEADRLIEKCARNQDDPLDSAFEGMKCFFNEVPEATGVF